LEQAEELQQRALRIREKALGPQSTQVADSYTRLAEIHKERGDLAGAEDFFRRAIGIWRNTAPEHPASASALTGLALLCQAKGEFAEAEALFQHSLEICEKAGGPQHPEVSFALIYLSHLYAAQGAYTKAIAAQSRANAIVEHNMVFSLATGSERQKLAFLSHLSEITDRIVTFGVLLDPGNPEAAQLAATTVLQRKGRVLDAMMDNLQSLRQRLGPADQNLLETFEDVTSQLAALVLGNLQAAAPPGRGARIKALEEERERLEAEICAAKRGLFRAVATRHARSRSIGYSGRRSPRGVHPVSTFQPQKG
jgi:tetratricopeptide (TPR) repeat protein